MPLGRFRAETIMNSPIPPESAARRLAAYSYLVAFANDDRISEEELAMLEKLALEDGEVDDQECEVLTNLFDRIGKETVTEAVWKEIERFKDEHGIE